MNQKLDEPLDTNQLRSFFLSSGCLIKQLENMKWKRFWILSYNLCLSFIVTWLQQLLARNMYTSQVYNIIITNVLYVFFRLLPSPIIETPFSRTQCDQKLQCGNGNGMSAVVWRSRIHLHRVQFWVSLFFWSISFG